MSGFLAYYRSYLSRGISEGVPVLAAMVAMIAFSFGPPAGVVYLLIKRTDLLDGAALLPLMAFMIVMLLWFVLVVIPVVTWLDRDKEAGD